MRTARALLQTIGLPALITIAAVPLEQLLAAEPAQPPSVPTETHRAAILGEHNVDITVDSTENPLVLMQTSAGDIVRSEEHTSELQSH